MHYYDLLFQSVIDYKGLGDEPNQEVFNAQKKAPVRVSRHRGYVRDEHDRFLPQHFNNMSMPTNIKD